MASIDLSVIIPVLHEEATINTFLDQLPSSPYYQIEVLVVDGDPEKSTLMAISDHSPLISLSSEKGRAKQMNAGASIAKGRNLLFLHADTILANNAYELIIETLSDTSVIAGAFDLQIDSKLARFKWLSRFANWRTHLSRIPFGDQALFIRRSDFFRHHCFSDLPIMEDVDFMMRLKKAKEKIILRPELARTSPRRWEKEGFIRGTARNLFLLTAFLLGVSTKRLIRFYSPHKLVLLALIFFIMALPRTAQARDVVVQPIEQAAIPVNQPIPGLSVSQQDRLTQAKEAIANEQFNVARIHLKKVIAEDRDNEALIGEVALAFYSISKFYSNAGNSQKAINYIEESLRYEPENVLYQRAIAQLYYQNALDYLKTRKYRKARASFEAALENGFESRGLYAGLAQINYNEGRIEDATTLYKKTLSVEATSSEDPSTETIQHRLDLIDKERPFLSDFRNHSMARFLFSAQKDLSKTEVRALSDILQRAYSRVTKALQHYPRQKVQAYFYPRDDYNRLFAEDGSDARSAALYDGKLRLPLMLADSDARYMTGIVWHEMTHVVIHDLSGGTCPRWLNEGIAELQQSRIDPQDISDLPSALRDGRIFSATSLFDSNVRNRTNGSFHLFYEQSHSMASYLMKRYRWVKVKKMLKVMSEGEPFESAFEDVMGKSFLDFHSEWQQMAEKGQFLWK